MPTSPSDPEQRWVRPALLAVVLVQLVVLYAPFAPSVGPVSWTDKIVHAAVFAIPAALIVLRGSRLWWLGVLVVHAPVSELVQHVLLPNRSGDPRDVAADLGGVLVGALAAVVWRARRRW